MDSYEREFEIQYLKSRGAAFQDFFSDIMERAYANDFQRIRPHGNTGDLKCDGYLQSTRTVFQVYGPDDARNLTRLLRKVRDDFDGAVRHWTGRMNRWVLVHNCQAGLPAQAVQLFNDLSLYPSPPAVEVWGYEELRRVFAQLSPDQRRSLFPPLWTNAQTLPNSRLPQADATARYWAWLAQTNPRMTSPAHLSALQGIELKIRLVLPDQVHERRIAEDRAIEESATDKTGWISRHDDGSFAKGLKRDGLDLSHVLRKHRYVLIVGDAGAGKSTFLHDFAVREATRLAGSPAARVHGQTPVLVELWRFAPHRPITELIAASVTRSEAAIVPDEIFVAVTRGYVVLLLDGLDEVPDIHRRECLAQIITLTEQHPRTRLVLTSRSFPEPPERFYQLAIAPLDDRDIANALCSQFGSGRTFQERFDVRSADEYVRSRLRPEVRQLCRTPLTLGLVLTLLTNNEVIPETLFGAYDRFLAWLLNWEVRHGHLSGTATAAAAVGEAAHAMMAQNQTSLNSADWAQAASRAVVALRVSAVASGSKSEDILRALLSTGLLQDRGGDVSFSHRSFMEFLAARRMISSATHVHADPVALNVGVARFLCGTLSDVVPLLEVHLNCCDDVQVLMPILKEASHSNCIGGRFEPLYDAIVDAQDMSVHLTHYLCGPDEEAFTGRVDTLVETCLDFRPKALTVLKEAADGIVRGDPWTHSRLWFEKIVAGLESYTWPGAVLHRRLVQMGVFENIDAFCDDGTDSQGANRCEALFNYLEAVYADDFTAASRHLTRTSQLLRNLHRRRPASANGHCITTEQ